MAERARSTGRRGHGGKWSRPLWHLLCTSLSPTLRLGRGRHEGPSYGGTSRAAFQCRALLADHLPLLQALLRADLSGHIVHTPLPSAS